MTMTSSSTLIARLRDNGYALERGAVVRNLLANVGSLIDWGAFVASWDDLAIDAHMADGGRYRRRRHARVSVEVDQAIARLPHGPHYQDLDYNSLNGGIERWFEPVTEAAFGSATMGAILTLCRTLFEAISPHRRWLVELHQFRIEARGEEAGQPTPEGAHRDGVDYVLVLMVRRENISSGVTMIAGPDGAPLGTFTLTAPFDAAFIDDHKVYHGVTAVSPVDPKRPAFRDVLVVTFKAVT